MFQNLSFCIARKVRTKTHDFDAMESTVWCSWGQKCRLSEQIFVEVTEDFPTFIVQWQMTRTLRKVSRELVAIRNASCNLQQSCGFGLLSETRPFDWLFWWVWHWARGHHRVIIKPATYRNRVLAFDEELDENLGSNNSSIFLQNNLLQEKEKNLWIKHGSRWLLSFISRVCEFMVY